MKRKLKKTQPKQKPIAKKLQAQRKAAPKKHDTTPKRTLKRYSSDVSVTSDGWPKASARSTARCSSSPKSPTASLMAAYFSTPQITSSSSTQSASAKKGIAQSACFKESRPASSQVKIDALKEQARKIATVPVLKRPMAVLKKPAAKEGSDNTAESATWGRIRKTLATNASYITYDKGSGWTSIFNISKKMADRNGMDHAKICEKIFEHAQREHLTKEELSQMRDSMLARKTLEVGPDHAIVTDTSNKAVASEGQQGCEEGGEEERPLVRDECVDPSGEDID